jgi:hypothetical protein
VGALAAAALLGLAPVLLLNGSTMRYLLDATPSIGILAAIGCWLAFPATDEGEAKRRSSGWVGLVVMVLVFSVIVGLLLGITGYGGHFEHNNPEWFKRAHDLFALAAGPGTSVQ